MHFLAKFSIDNDESSVLPQPVDLLKVMLSLFCLMDIQGREFAWLFKICLYQWPVLGHFGTNLFQFGVRLDMTKLNSIIPV